jgi:tRNA(Ile)-lysidine synthase
VRQLARLWGLPLVVGKADVKRLARRRALGLEEAARLARYKFLERVARKAAAALVAVGHQRQDQAETVLMNFLRGSGVRGLAGMPIRRPIQADSSVVLIRPLLEVGREELLDYLRARGLNWVEDETNRSLGFRRNRVRGELLPLLERRHAPGLGRRLVQMAEQFEGLQELLAGRAAAAWDDVVVSATGRAVAFRLDRLRAEGRAVAGEILLTALERLGFGRRAVTAEHLSAVWQVITSPAGGQTLQLPAGARITRLGRHLRLYKKR